MRKFTAILMVAILAITITACSSSKPSLSEVEKAISNGTLTVNDAYEKGYVDEAWVEKYNLEKEEVPAADKTTSNMIDSFESQTSTGEVYTSDTLSPVTFFAFVNPLSENGNQSLEAINESYDAVIAAGADVLIINIGTELIENSNFTVIQYNDSIKQALGSLESMINEDGFSGSWNVNGAFLSAWHTNVDAEKFSDAAKVFVEMAGISADNNNSVSVTPMG